METDETDEKSADMYTVPLRDTGTIDCVFNSS